MKKSARRPSTSQHLLYGVNPLMEALRARRVPDQITIAEGARDERLRELIELARSRGVPITFAPRTKIDREAGHSYHSRQSSSLGVILRRSVRWLGFRAFLEQAHQLSGNVVNLGLDVALLELLSESHGVESVS